MGCPEMGMKPKGVPDGSPGVASLVIPFGGILFYKHWKMAFFSYGTMPLHASTDAEHEFMNCLMLDNGRLARCITSPR